MPRPLKEELRFSVEVIAGERWILCDWKYGIYRAAGRGLRHEQQRTKTQALHILDKWGDVYVGAPGKAFFLKPEWPGGHPPPERPGWLAEQTAILRAYDRIGRLMRQQDMPHNLKILEPEIVLAVRNAERLRAAALRSVGLEPVKIELVSFPVEKPAACRDTASG